MKAAKTIFQSRAIIFMIGLVAVLCTLTQAQDSAAGTNKKWVRVEAPDRSISFLLPSGFIVDAEKREADQRFKIFAFDSGVVIEFSVRRPADGARENLERINPMEGETTQFVKGRFKGRRNASGDHEDFFSESIFLASEKDLYWLRVVSRSKTNKVIERFLRSIKIDDKPLYVVAKPPEEPEETVSMTSLVTNAEVKAAFDQKIEKDKSVSEILRAAIDKDRYDYDKFSRPPIILSRPYPLWRPEGSLSTSNSIYSAFLKVEFLANGRIGKINAYSQSEKRFVEACIDAARKIRFIPAQIDGKTVDATDIVEYSLVSTTIMTPMGR